VTSRGSEDAVLFGPALWKEPIVTLQEILLYFSKEWAVLMSAPRTFVVLLVIGVAVGYAASSWYYSGVVSAKSALPEQKEGSAGSL
jgi:hypothetical protein